MKMDEAAAMLLVAALNAEESTGNPVLYGTYAEIGSEVGLTADQVSRAVRLTRKEEWIESERYTFPELGNGRSAARHGLRLEYDRDSIPMAGEHLAAHALRLHKALRSLTAQYKLADGLTDGRTLLARRINLALKAVDFAADSLAVGFTDEEAESPVAVM